MLEISLADIVRRITRDNPWWANVEPRQLRWSNLTRRDYFDAFCQLTTDLEVARSTILLGPRRVGKTVMLHHFIYKLIADGVDSRKILYVSIDTPVYFDIRLEKFVEIFVDINKIEESQICYVIFDEIQYLKDWEIHLKDLTDSYPNIKFVASGSAAAALNLKSRESGAGRFSDFMLPPLTFLEFMKFVGKVDECAEQRNEGYYRPRDIFKLNKCFVDYINFGGFPEVALIDKIKENIDSFVKNDIIDKVLLKDLPNLYGIQNIQDLNNIFKLLAYNNGQEVGLEAIAQQSSVPKANIKSFIEYLVSAFLISQHDKLPTSGKQMIRKRNFKVFLTNPSMRAALFSPVDESETDTIGHLAEAAILSQWDHLSRNRQNYYYRDQSGNEVDIVRLDHKTMKPVSPVEIKWSDRVFRDIRANCKGLFYFLNKYHIDSAVVTSKTITRVEEIDGRKIIIIPTSVYCLNLGAATSQMAIAERMMMASMGSQSLAAE